MQNKKKTTAKNILLTGTLIAGSVIGLGSLNANTLETFKYHELGSGGELRSELLNNQSSDIMAFELDCGEYSKKAEDTKKAKDKNTDLIIKQLVPSFINIKKKGFLAGFMN